MTELKKFFFAVAEHFRQAHAGQPSAAELQTLDDGFAVLCWLEENWLGGESWSVEQSNQCRDVINRFIRSARAAFGDDSDIKITEDKHSE